MSVKPLATLACLVLLLSPNAGRTQEGKEFAYRSVPGGVLESILRDLNIRFKKTTGKGAIFFYDYERNGFKIRLANFGPDLMLDALFEPVAVDRINQWNVRAKFSRGVVYPGNGKPHTALESNLDCVGGVTSGAVRQFIHRFDNEVKTFSQFLADAGTGGPVNGGGPVSETVTRGIANDLLEDVLKGLNRPYAKTVLKNGAGVAYDYDSNNYKIRLFNFGGKDLMVSAEFRKTTLAEANAFNLKKKFIRAVVYRDNGREYTALEANLDAEGGVTENLLRTFLTSFDGAVQDFDRFLGR